jgi:ribosomal protein S12 methylthiotransferase
VDAILEMAELKGRQAGRRLIVTGCLAERYRDELKKEIPEIDAVLGTGEVPRILEAIGSSPAEAGAHIGAAGLHTGPAGPDNQAQPLALYTRGPGGDLTPTISPRFGIDLPEYLYDADTPRRLATPGHYAYLKIAEGCDYKCAFCIIPKMRGHYRSRTHDSIVREAHALAARGVKELLLISQDTTFYGVDRKERGALARLLRELNSVAGIEWIRLLYLYPTTISADVIEAMADCEKVCNYIDLPLQHASDPVLARMKRPGTRASYERLLTNIRERIPNVSLRTTFIVGFPGETEEDFDQLMDFVGVVGFDHVGVFTYSHEDGTSAFGLKDDVPARVKQRRRSALMARQKGLVMKRHRSRLGERTRLMVDGPSPEQSLVLQGRLQGHAPEIDPVVYLTECGLDTARPGDILDVEIVGNRHYDLVARPV